MPTLTTPTIQQLFEEAAGHFNAGRLQQAEPLFRQILVLQPVHVDAQNILGVIAAQTGRLDLAEELFRQLIARHPNRPEVYGNLGRTLALAGKFTEAMDACQRALALQANFPQASRTLAWALIEMDRLEEAMAVCNQAISHDPNFAEAWNCLGWALWKKGELDSAISAYRQAIAISPRYPDAHNNLGTALKEKGDFDAANTAYRNCIDFEADHTIAHLNLALVLLMQGDYLQGWEEYQWRWRLQDRHLPQRGFSQPRWDGSELGGRTLLLHAEQGIGDTIQFIRYLPQVLQRGGKVIVECPEELMRLFRQIPGVEQWIVSGQPLPPFDTHCPLMSLPVIFKTTVQTIPPAISSFQADPRLIEFWKEKMRSKCGEMKIGLAWAGRPTHVDDRKRSMALSALGPVLRMKSARFYSLQKGEAAGQIKLLPEGIRPMDLTEDLKDFADTAALISNLDLVLTVDTAVVHLAGALGKPAWVMLPFVPDWRWLLGRQDSPWYRTLRLFRQVGRGDWESVVRQVADALEDLARQRQTQT